MVSLAISHLLPSQPVYPNKTILMGNAHDRDRLPSDTKRVAVIGAGVSGLAAAYKLKSKGLSVTLLEADERVGGKIKTVVKNGLIWDEGANTMTESEPEVTSLLDDLGLRDKQQFPISQNKRYIARDGLALLLPSDPISLVKSNILSAQSKLQILLEPIFWKKRHSSEEQTQESVADFFSRHFGQEFVDYLIDPFVAGTSAGDPKSLSMRHSFPKLWDIENRFGSIISGAIQSKLNFKSKTGGEKNLSDTKPRSRGSFSFNGGMQTLVDTISKKFSEDELKLQCKVLSLSYSHGGQSENWCLSCLSNKTIEDQLYDAVVVTAPLSNVKEMKILNGRIPFSIDFIPEVNYLPLSVVITAFKKASVRRPLEGFGVLIPSKEQQKGLKTLGTLFSSMMFPDRAPSDQYLYTTFVGGSRNRQLALSSTDELKKIVSSDLQQLLGVDGEPSFVNHFCWSKAFPLYGRDYDSVLRAIEKMEKGLPGFVYAGNKDGLSVGKAIASGYKAADVVISYLNSHSSTKQTV